MKIQQDYILMILNCERYRYKAEYQKKTWLSTLDIFYLHILGKEDLENEYQLELSSNTLYVKCKDDYISLASKTYYALKAINDLFEYKHIFKTDDDQDLTKPILFTTLKNLFLKKELHYGGKIITITQPYYSEYYKIHPELPKDIPIYPTKYCNGRFYFLSKEAVQYLLKQKYYIIKEYMEDYAIGFHLHSEYKKNMLNICADDIFKDTKEENYINILGENYI
jgi:hypothetical protein